MLLPEEPLIHQRYQTGIQLSEMVGSKSVRRCDEKLDAAALTAIFTTVRADRSITVLHLSNAGLTPSLVVQIADFLEQNATLTRVDLSSNPIGGHGATCLAASIAKNSTLTSLSLAKCGLKNESLAPWIEFFQARDPTATKSTLTEIKCVACCCPMPVSYSME